MYTATVEHPHINNMHRVIYMYTAIKHTAEFNFKKTAKNVDLYKLYAYNPTRKIPGNVTLIPYG